jgi:hypothetical protein
VPELHAELVALLEPALGELGTRELLAVLDPRTCEGDRQLATGRAHGLEAVAAEVADLTVRSP